MRKKILSTLCFILLFSGAANARDSVWAEKHESDWQPASHYAPQWEDIPSHAYRVPNSVAQHETVSYVTGDWTWNAKVQPVAYHVTNYVSYERHPASIEVYSDTPHYPHKKWLTPTKKYNYWE